MAGVRVVYKLQTASSEEEKTKSVHGVEVDRTMLTHTQKGESECELRRLDRTETAKGWVGPQHIEKTRGDAQAG